MALKLVTCILMEDPEAAVATEALLTQARPWRSILSNSNINLKVASEKLQGLLDGEVGEESIAP